ncbi:MAG: PRC-barrel domain-containing protein [Steroidobacteraceae bacterium]|nr:PRC-barrel domain-containing protein [Steroidobacteraceae bacterium]
MLHRIDDLVGYVIAATDGELGHVRDLYFDDDAWVVRYLVVDTGSWLSDRKVLVSPMALSAPNSELRAIPAHLTREQVRNSPGIDTDRPVSRQHELEFSGFYGYPYYWGGGALWGAEYYPGAMLTGVGYDGSGSEYLVRQVERERLAREVDQPQRENDDPHLRSCKEVTGYHIEAVDGEIGHVQGMLVDEKSWAIRFLVVNTSNWWLGHKVLIAPEWITDVRWSDQKVMIDLTRQAIQGAPPYDPAQLPDRAQERLVYEHYGRDGYWHRETRSSIGPPVESSNARR